MWKDYSKSYIKNNRASSRSVIAAALIATLFLSLLCSLAYNFWIYEIEKIELEEGDWQGRIVGELQEGDIFVIENFANVEKAVINEKESDEKGTVIDIYFKNARTIYRDMPLILKQLGLGEDAVSYHELLLSRYFIHDPADSTPPLLLALYLAVLLIMSFSLVLIIRNSFELYMNARVHQFGIFSSIGATPQQIRTCLLQEAAVLCGIPIVAGCLAGILLSLGVIEAINSFAMNVSGRHEAVFGYHPVVLVITLFAAIGTVFFSAWIPARKLSRMTPLEAIRNSSGFQLKKKKNSRFLSFLFGIEGELAGNALKAQKKSLRISSISLFLSFFGFSVMLCFTTLAGISTRYTYFERYQDAWDVMVTVKDTDINKLDFAQKVKEVEDIGAVTIYQQAETKTFLAEEEQSEELRSLGGMEAVATAEKDEHGFWVDTQIVVLDDASFLDYCMKIGIEPDLNGTVILNQIWDSVNSNFRNKEYIPFIKEDSNSITLYSNIQAGQTVEVPIIAYTKEIPVLREEYDNYHLIQFVSASMWKNLLSPFEAADSDTCIRAFSDATPTLENLNELEKRLVQLVGKKYEVESENRIQEKLSNDDLMDGMVAILGGFCVLLAFIGITNVFSNTLGFIRQRKREFAQYMSIGLTPAKMKKMFCIEAIVIAGKPLLSTLILTVVSVQFMVTASYLNPMVFWSEAPLIPIMIFAATVIAFVALAYFIGGKRILQCDLNEALRNDIIG